MVIAVSFTTNILVELYIENRTWKSGTTTYYSIVVLSNWLDIYTKKQYIITDYWSSMAQLVPGKVTSEVIKKRFTLKNDNLAKIDQSEIAPINYYWQLRWQIRRKGDLMLPYLYY